jgi:Fe2+ or Zn2+ uptake regulation protein
MTASRRTIAACVDAMPGAFTAEDLGRRARVVDVAAGATATVYRALAAMERSGYVERVGQRDTSALYARCGAGAPHHHYIVCDGCGRVAPANCPLDTGELARPDASGFTIRRHEITLYGLCPDCSEGVA